MGHVGFLRGRFLSSKQHLSILESQRFPASHHTGAWDEVPVLATLSDFDQPLVKGLAPPWTWRHGEDSAADLNFLIGG